METRDSYLFWCQTQESLDIGKTNPTCGPDSWASLYQQIGITKHRRAVWWLKTATSEAMDTKTVPNKDKLSIKAKLFTKKETRQKYNKTIK